MQDKEAKAKTDAYAKAREVAQRKAADFDATRDAARSLNKELEQASLLLKQQEVEVARLSVSVCHSTSLTVQLTRHISTLLQTHQGLMSMLTAALDMLLLLVKFCFS